jgi:hypothetical protein
LRVSSVLVGRVSAFATLSAIVVACSSSSPGTEVEDGGSASDSGGDASVVTPPGVDAGSDGDSAVTPIDATPPKTCGAGKPDKCKIGEPCDNNDECISELCAAGKCKASCSNKQQDGDEVGVDCGGVCPVKCDGQACTVKTECQSGICFELKCAPPGTKTCGVGLKVLCANGEPCGQDKDCTTDYCAAGNTCAAVPADVHTDGRRNGGETGIDCGGTAAPTLLCPAGQGCDTSADCVSDCNAQKLCNAPGPTDGKKNNGETDVDCGGPNAPGCATGKACEANADCKLKACTAKACVVPTASDGVRNGNETDVDCGGGSVTDGVVTYTAPRCKDNRTCAADADCVTNACSPGNKCVAKSCDTAETAGIVTCGQKEVGAVDAVHESCCKTLTLPTRTTRRMDKYEITAGRMRSFVTDVGPNVRAWVAAYIAANPTSQLATLNNAGPVVASLWPAADSGGPLNLTAHLGAIDIDNYNGIRGCYNYYDVNNPNNGSYGASAYWMPAAKLATYGLPPAYHAREIKDVKSQNCLMPMMYAAFCAWDGGELAVQADYNDAGYPGSVNRPNVLWCNGTPGNGGWGCQDTSLGNNGVFYQWPVNVPQAPDLSIWYAAPGRFPLDVSVNRSVVDDDRWMDLGGNLGEYTGDFTASGSDFCDYSAAPLPGATTCTRSNKVGSGTRYTNIPVSRIVGRTWEGHNYGAGQGGFPVTFQYGKFGGRCTRPAQ